tara:strand:- start:46 stop:1071 length:1026 start_codon:yes stop_codon:yes gene_type:complete
MDEKLRIDSSGRTIINNTNGAQDGAAKLQIKGGTAANILTADITDETVAVFGGSSPGTTQTGYGAGIVIKPIISRGSHFFLGACNSGSNQEGNGIFVIRQGHLAANSTERLRINQNGHVEIQDRLWVPGSKLISLGNVSSSPHFSFYKDDATGVNHITSNSGAEIKVSSGNGDSNGIEFWDYTGTNKRCQIDGHGIKFNSDTAQANALDDYEEGNFTATYSVASGSITTFSNRGEYVKVGRVVHIMFSCSANGSNNPSGQVTITGLPFTVELPNANGPRGGGGVVFAGYHAPPELATCNFSGTTINLRLNDNTLLQANTSGTGFGYNAYQISGFGSYMTTE